MNNATKIEEARKKLGLTQFQAAALCGVSLNAYIKWEKGVSKPNETNKEKVKDILKLKEV
jgi:DNA-binding XRE family transcriptional regulator